ncbi:MAG TPA: sugar ABC transporter substrate-binding protein [Leifsonia sp.]|jgi:multiple sugar transport system substrate-binding protein
MNLHTFTRGRGRKAAVLALAAAAGISVALSGCSGGGGGASSGGDGKATVTYGIWDVTQAVVMKQLAAEFHKKNPNITVQVQVTPWDSYWTKLKTAATGGSAPDVFWMNDANFEQYASGGAIKDLQPMVGNSDIKMSNYVAAQANAYTYNGHPYGIPKDVDSIALWYNKKLFKEAGVKPPTPSWTGDDLLAAAQKLTNPAKGVFGIAAQNTGQQSYYVTIPQEGGYVISPDKKKSGLDSPESIKGIQFWTDMINKYHVSPTLQAQTDTAADNMFEAGKIAMIYEGSWAAAEFAGVPYTKENADVAPLPKLAQAGGVSNGLANVMSAKTQHPDQAWKWLEFLGSKHAADVQAQTGIVIPAYNGTAEEWTQSPVSKLYNLQPFADDLKVATAYPSSQNTAAWGDAIATELNKAYTGDETAEQAAKNAAAIMNKALAAEKH